MTENRTRKLDIKNVDRYIGRGIIIIGILGTLGYFGTNAWSGSTEDTLDYDPRTAADIPSTPSPYVFMTESERSYYYQLLTQICPNKETMYQVISYLDINDAEVERLRSFTEIEQRVYFALLCQVNNAE